MGQMVDVDVNFIGGVADGLVHQSRGEDGAPPGEWGHPNAERWDVYLHEAAGDAPGIWSYTYDRTEEPI